MLRAGDRGTTRTMPSSEEPADGRAFDLPGGPDSVLLLHGLTGSPFEVRPIADRLQAAGMRCRAPVLAGHGGPPAALAGVLWTEWVASARRELCALEGARRTFVVGCSMGALVACVLAHELPERVDGLALLAPALRLAWPGRLAVRLARTNALGRVIVPKASSDVRDPAMRRRNPTMRGTPLASVAELAALAGRVDAILPGIAAPALVVAGRHDHTVTLAGARRVARRIGSGPARVVVLRRSYHLVGIDVERERCAELVHDFFEGIPVPAGREAAGAAGAATPRG